MALKRRTFNSTQRLAGFGLGLCLALAFAFYLGAELPHQTQRLGHAHFGSWLGRKFYQLTSEVDLWLHMGHRARSRTAHETRPTVNPYSEANIDPVAALGVDPTGLREALALYKAGQLQTGDAVAATAKDPLVRTTLAWIALRTEPGDRGFDRMRDFLAAHPGWPTRIAIERRMEEMLFLGNSSAERIEHFFAEGAPMTAFGKLALARAYKSDGDAADAQRLIREVWHKANLPASIEAKLKTEFASDLSKEDFKVRADYLLYQDDFEAGLRAASVAGAPEVALAKLRVAAANNTASDKMFSAIPKPMQSDPGYLFAKIQKLQHANKFKEAATVLLAAMHERSRLLDGDEWWFEARKISRKLLDDNEAALAYRLCAENTAVTDEFHVEAEFQAGWIALRFLNDPERAAKHFATAYLYADTPISIARARYWQGRAAEVGRNADAALARSFYEAAAEQSSTYYGQLAREHLGLTPTVLRTVQTAAKGPARDEAVRAVELLYTIGEKEAANALAIADAHYLTSESQLAALAKIIAVQRDAHISLTVGKILSHRRIAIDSLAFPTYGVPQFQPVENSASPAIVYAIARQESAFDARASSSAGAKGLMQMIAATAKRTAERAGLAFDPVKLADDAAFNAKLGAAHLGTLFDEEKGCPILVFAAYNAGGGRVKQWINAYGDPRSPNVDPVDWVERIPFAETRNYVQRVMENLTVYETRFGETPRGQMLREINAKL
jgi:soluble lytic murein transglycosylase